jgi:hypothetical protein
MHLANEVPMIPTVFWTQIITREKENQENGIYDCGVGEIYGYIEFRKLVKCS